MFSGVGTDDKREESDELEPKTTPTNEKEVGAEDNVEEKDNTPTTPEEEIVEPKPEKELTPNKKSEGSLWTRIRRWVDDAFTTDELI
jgi:hypothetical protein